MSRNLSLSLAAIATLVGMVLFGCGGGGLADGGTPFGAGVGSLALRISSGGVTNRGTSLIRAVPPEVVLFEIHVQDAGGTDLVPVVQVQRPTGSSPVTVTIENVPVGDVVVVVLGLDASGITLVADKTNVTVVEGINPAIAVTPSPFSPSPSPSSSVTPSPTTSPSPAIQRFAVVANEGDNNITSYLIDGTSAALTAKSTVGTGAAPVWVVANGARNTVYVADQTAKTLSAFRIDGSGNLSIFDAAFPRTTTGTPNATVVEGSGSFVYTAVAGPDQVEGVQVNPTTGQFVKTLPSETLPGAPVDIRFLAPNFIVVATSSEVKTYTFDTVGVLTFANAYSPGTGSIRSITTRGTDPGRTTGLVFVAIDESTNSRVESVDVNLTDGTLSFVDSVAGPSFPNEIAGAGASEFLYVGSVASATISIFKTDLLTGSLAANGTFNLPGSTERVQALAMAGDGASLFATITTGEIQNFFINLTTGGLTAASPRVNTGTSPVSLTVF